MSEPEIPKCFLAYGSASAALEETLELAIEQINQTGIVNIKSWRELQIGGRVLITTICQEIESRGIFIADVTRLNANVLFELGYAIAKNRRIWLIVDAGVERSKKEIDGFQLLSTIGYRPYNNHIDVQTAFHLDKPYETLEQTTYRDLIQQSPSVKSPTRLLFLKSLINTDASIRLSRRVQQAKLPSVVDDPSEARIQALTWYMEETRSAFAVIAHLLGHNHKDWQFHNAKLSFVCGMAHGFGKPILMLAHAPYDSPLDYKELLVTHPTATQCIATANEWLATQETNFKEQQQRLQENEREIAGYAGLQDIAIGDPIAEHETETLGEYFIHTSAYNDALVSKHSVFIGRKGTGKTASLYQLSEEISRDTRNHVCVIKPVAYEVEGVLRVLQDASVSSQQGYLIESLWKFLIYTELAKSFYEQLKNKPAFYEQTNAEKEFCAFVEEHWGLVLGDFSLRLEQAVNNLHGITKADTAQSQRLKISELLHDDILPTLRSLLGQVLSSKNKVTVLIDNLDKAWDPKGDMQTLSIFIFGLLAVGGRVTQDFQKSGYWKESVSLSLTIFLRSDIYAAITRFAKERDKLPIRAITWEDPLLLRRVIEERFVHAGAQVIQQEEIWSRYFCSVVAGQPTRDYLSAAVLPKPRDLIFLSKTALAIAVNRKHARIQEADILEAVKQYSRYALDALLVENFTRIENLEEFLYEFAGRPAVITMDDVKQAAHRCNITTDTEEIVEALIEGMFLGVETAPGQFNYLYNENDKMKLMSMARRLGGTTGGMRFEVNNPFRPYLEIQGASGANSSSLFLTH